MKYLLALLVAVMIYADTVLVYENGMLKSMTIVNDNNSTVKTIYDEKGRLQSHSIEK